MSKLRSANHWDREERKLDCDKELLSWRNQLLVLKSILSGQALENEDVNASLQNN